MNLFIAAMRGWCQHVVEGQGAAELQIRAIAMAGVGGPCQRHQNEQARNLVGLIPMPWSKTPC